MNIAGILVHSHPEKTDAVREALKKLPGVEVHMETPDGRLVVTAEDTDQSNTDSTVLNIHRIDGVVAASLVYHNFETEDDFNTDKQMTQEMNHARHTA